MKFSIYRDDPDADARPHILILSRLPVIWLKRPGDFLADATGCTRDDRHLIVELHAISFALPSYDNGARSAEPYPPLHRQNKNQTFGQFACSWHSDRIRSI